MAQHLARFGEVHLSGEIERQLGEISPATVTRLLGRFRRDSPRLPRRGPESANRLAREIPMGRIPWETSEPGHFEMDLVHHCGEATVGDYVHTLQLVDVATGWSERVGIFGRTHRAMVAGSEKIVARVPFPIRELHPDNGSEFINDHILTYFDDKVKGLSMSWSRPYHKNDNRNVEQKNYSLVRAYLGYERLDTAAQSMAVNALYDRMWVSYNLFQPVMHLESKEVGGGNLIRRRWDEARTPYERVLAAGVLSTEQQARLTGLNAATNPRKLRREIRQIIETLWEEPRGTGEAPTRARSRGGLIVGKTACGNVDSPMRAPACPHFHRPTTTATEGFLQPQTGRRRAQYQRRRWPASVTFSFEGTTKNTPLGNTFI